jgi:branched-subunit amino acid permease
VYPITITIIVITTTTAAVSMATTTTITTMAGASLPDVRAVASPSLTGVFSPRFLTVFPLIAMYL